MTRNLMFACMSCLDDLGSYSRYGHGPVKPPHNCCDFCGQSDVICLQVENAVLREGARKQTARPLKFKEIREDDRLLSEQFRLAGEAWAEADGAANLLENLKSVTLDQRKAKLILERGDMPDNKAERIAKSDPEWEEYIREMVRLRMNANKLKVAMEVLRYRFSEWQSRDANQRHEARLSR